MSAKVHLEALKLTGFKSFPDEVELKFPARISAVIGPNGCGKSNLVDAILWVLGEQSPSLLRLKNMGDVVFSGSAKRKPAGAAEVSLMLRSDDGRWGESGGRLEIRRRVYSTGPSDYRLNGKSARLRDVHDELHSIGLGTRGYSIIEQGRVGQVLSARPTDRRILIEEAAGITHYKVRRREAELKLEHTRQNLLRLEDVITEVDRSLRQLKRQARQADKHHKIEEQLRATQLRLFTVEAHQIDQQKAEIRRTRARIQNDVAAAAAALGGVEADLTGARRDHEGRRQEVEKVRTEVAELIASRERLEAFLERSADLLDSIRSNLEKNRRDEAGIHSTKTELAGKRDEATSRLETLSAELTAVSARVDEAAATEKAARERFENLDKTTAQQRQDLLGSISSLTDSRNRFSALERDQDRLNFALGQNEQELERHNQRLAEIQERFKTASSAREQAAAEAEQLSEQQRQITAERTRLRAETVAAKHEAEALGHRVWDLRHKLTGLDKELANHAAAVDDVTNILSSDAVLGQISDFLHPEQHHTADLDQLWGDLLETPVVSVRTLTPEQRRRAQKRENSIRLACREADLQPLPWPDLEGCEPMFECAGIIDEDCGWLSRCLPPAYRCSDENLALELAAHHPQVRILDCNGMLHHGLTVAPTTAGTRLRGALALRAEHDAVKTELSQTQDRTDLATGLHKELGADLATVEHQLTELAQSMLEAEQERARRQAVEQSIGKELERIEREIAAMQAEISRNRDLSTDMTRRRSRLEQEVTDLEQRSLGLEQAVEENNEALAGLRDESGQALRHLDHCRAEHQLAAEREAAQRTENRRLDREFTDLGNRLERLGTEISDLEKELQRTEDEVVRSRSKLAEEQGLLANGRETERVLSEKVEAIGARVQALENEVKQRREVHDAARETLHESEVEQTRVAAEWDRLRDATLSELTRAPETLLGAEIDPEDRVDTLRASIDTLRLDLEKIGPVNLLAIKEVEELGERSVFLKAQRRDLTESLKSIDETIREIDTTCTERFIDTFVQVNAVFTETFSNLFGGGTARLDLVDEDDPLESGIDITAQPPGKKNQSVQLLSGGEKALTALSLLISLFRIKPSPFCVLDEVDAPLDDANVHRLAELVQSMTDHTQFVLVTHNRRTMARADVLYGVTMEEAGVSKVVSARIEE